MRTIKFRGKVTYKKYNEESRFDNEPKEGDIIYGDYAAPTENITYPAIRSHEFFYYYPVDKATQLCGYDKNGKEVYEGDILVDADGRRVKAALCPNFTGIAVLEEH